VSVILIITTPSDGDIVTSYDTGPHTGSPVIGFHDRVKSVRQISIVANPFAGVGGPVS